ncbi:OprO/OprP family phosphate-selective porin [Colwellia sp. Bg11-28]|uniref:OprO/OprP family phosphate-selective porin n=1 Tax=Colwellia sp. Bg11-28 TaxID=2058305 RepID=UPI0012FF3ED3|nr:porin [Colwellia sp. Bg11-28]
MIWTTLSVVIFTLTQLSICRAEQVSQEPIANVPEVVEQKIVIRNITFVDPAKKKKSTTANLVITNKLFDLVTQDDIDVGHGDIIFDAQNGFILGSLESGEIANFLILDADPHENIEALLDTKKHVLLAIHNGVIIRNNLRAESNISALAEQKRIKPKRTGWLSYTPPPIVLPSNYKDADWIKFDNDYFSTILIGALALDRQSWESQDEASLAQVGDLQDFNGGEIRALRFGIAGAIKFDKPWIYMITGATNTFDKGFDTNTTDNVSFMDWRLDIPTFYNTTLSIGKQKEPISMERLMSMTFLPMQERALVSDALLPSRNFGAVLSGITLNQKLTWAGGVFNNWIEDEGSLSENSTELVGRTTWLPYLSEDENELIHLAFGLRYSNAKEGLRYASEPEFNKSATFVDTGNIDADNSVTYNLEASWRKGPVWLIGEYTKSKVAADYLQNPELSGYHVSAVFSVTGEMREYNKRSGTFSPLRVARSVEQGGWGALEVSTRWSVFDGSDGGLAAGDTSILSVGFAWWLTPKFNVNFNYRWIDLDRCSFISEACNLQGRSSGFNTRLALFL